MTDVTEQVDFGSPDDEYLPMTKCVCGEKFKAWDWTISIYSEGTSCPKCGRKFYFRNKIRVFLVEEHETN